MTEPRKSAIAVRHVAFEDLGLLAPVLERGGWSISYRDAALDSLTAPEWDEAALVVVLGGPIGVYEADKYPFLAAETELLERRLRAGRATLGICLGCQLMAHALGARVFAGGRKEIGWGRVSLTPEGRASALAPLAAGDVLHWHGDTFDLPRDAVRLAFNDNYQNQAFAVGSHGLALQFHVEADPTRLESWYVGHACELAGAGISVPDLRARTAELAAGAEHNGRAIFERWLAEVAAE